MFVPLFAFLHFVWFFSAVHIYSTVWIFIIRSNTHTHAYTYWFWSCNYIDRYKFTLTIKISITAIGLKNLKNFSFLFLFFFFCWEDLVTINGERWLVITYTVLSVAGGILHRTHQLLTNVLYTPHLQNSFWCRCIYIDFMNETVNL